MKPFHIPPGKKTGCLPRKTLICSQFPALRDRIEVMSILDIQEAIDARKAAGIRRRNFILQIFDQDGVGSCATEVTAQAIQSTKKATGQQAVLLNPWFIYQATSGGVDQGSSIDEDLEFGQKYGCASEAVWPRSKGWNAKPSQAAYADALQHTIGEIYEITSKIEAQTALALGFFLQFGHDSHSELMVDLLSLEMADVAGSWGNYDYGGGADGGFHPYPLDGIDYRYGCFAIRCN